MHQSIPTISAIIVSPPPHPAITNNKHTQLDLAFSRRSAGRGA